MTTSTFVEALALGQTLYAATIVSFIGGIRWGHTIQPSQVLTKISDKKTSHDIPPQIYDAAMEYSQPNWPALSVSIGTSLTAWMALLVPSPFTECILIAALVGSTYNDVQLPGYPRWFKALRMVLAFGACSSMLGTLYALIRYKKSMKSVEQS